MNLPWNKKEKQSAVTSKIDTIPPLQAVIGGGVLDPRSQAWMFVEAWATERLQRAREKNDNTNRDLNQTSVLRGEIKILKELINLPNPKNMKGLLEED